jgi:hypothetical protein
VTVQAAVCTRMHVARLGEAHIANTWLVTAG